MKEHGQSGFRIHAPENATDRSATTDPSTNTRELNVATFNVRTLKDTTSASDRNIGHKLQQIAIGCDKYHIDIVALQEHRLNTSDGDDIDYQHFDGWTLAHTSSSPTSHGVAILYNKRVAKVLSSVEHKSDRIIVAHLQGNPKMCVISAYAPTEPIKDSAYERMKDVFYHDLEELICSIPPHTVIILAGDFNARIGMDSHESNPRIVGPNCYHAATNHNGVRLLKLCESTNLRPAHTHFGNRRSRLATFHPVNPEHPMTQIDHIMINTKWWKSIKSCRAFNTIDIGSDHKVVTAHFRLSLRATKCPPNDRCKFNNEKLADPNVRAAFNVELSNRFNLLLDETLLSESSAHDKIQLRSDALDKALIETSRAILGKRKRRQQPSWVSNSTLQLIDAQAVAKTTHKRLRTPASKQQLLDLQKQVTAALERDEEAHLNDQLNDLELASKKREYGTVWQIVGHISGPPKKPVKVRKLDGTLPKRDDEIIAEWRNYFEKLLNNKNANASADHHPPPAPPLREIQTAPISFGEVSAAIKSLKRGKAPGPDYAMTTEVIKDGGDFIVRQLHIICQLVYEECHAPSQWTSSLIIPLPKKGNLQMMTNYRGISLMSIAAKVFNRVLLNRIRKPIDALLRRNQAGFRTGRSCIQQIHILRRIMDGAYSNAIPLFITFIDFKKAFDSIDRAMMFAILRHYGIPEQIVNAIRVLYDNSKSRVYIDGQVSKHFDITTGVLQGDVLAPFLFIIVIDHVTKLSAGDFGYLTHKGSDNNSGRSTRSTTREASRRINDLAFADDIALLENDNERAQKQLDAHRHHASTVGLEINIKKTEQLRLNYPDNTQPFPPLQIDGQPIAIVDEFKYLGSYMGSTDKDIHHRIAMAWAAFENLKKILASRTGKPTVKIKLRLFNAACLSILLYGCETWILTAQQSAKLDIFARTCYRIMLGIRQSETHTTNEQLYKLASARPVSDIIRERQLQFIGHCLRMPSEEPANIYALYTSQVAASHRRGRGNLSFLAQISSYLCSDSRIKLTAAEIAKYAKDKSNWNKLVAAPPTRGPDR